MNRKGSRRWLRQSAWITSGLAGFLIPMASSVQAATAPVTFAQVIESTANGNPNVFAYLDNGPGTGAEFGTDVGGVFGAAAPAEFTFLSVLGSLPADLAGVQDATISLTSSTTSPVTVSGPFGDEPINGSGTEVDVLKITRDTPAAEGGGARTNLLTMTFTGQLLGAIGGATPQLSGNSALGDTVTYSSDFLSFAQSTEQDFSVTFSSWGPAVPPPPGLSVATDGFYNDATAAGAGTFDFQGNATRMPEPGSVSLIVLGSAALLAGGRRSGRRLVAAR